MPLFRYRGPRLPARTQRPLSDGSPDGPGRMVEIASQADPAAYLRWMWSPAGPHGDPIGRRLPIGVLTNNHWAITTPDTHLLALGPPRSIAGKTASVMIPTILTAAGPVVSASTKDDVIAATAIARAQKGQLWVYAPDGVTQVPQGCKPLRWSPVDGADDWGVALQTTAEMVAALKSSDVRGGEHWKDRAADLLATVLHWAARSKRTMKDARDAVYGLLNPVGNTTVGGRIQSWLAEHDAEEAAALLGSVLYAGQEERGSIMSTASRALRGYRLPGAIASTEKPNFDPEAFVRGGVGGRADTVYIMSTSRQQEDVAPLVVALLGRIREAAYKVHREHGSIPSTVFCLDELYGLAPIPSLPAMLTDGGSQGLLIAGAVQDLTLIKSRWPHEADGFLTLFGNVLVFPGIRDGKTLDLVSKLVGDYDRDVVTYGSGGGHQPTEQHSTRREPIYPPSKIAAGIKEGNPDVLIFLHQWGYDELRATPWWRFDPWPQVLAVYLLRAAFGVVPEWRLSESQYTGERPDVLDELAHLPLPDLGQWVAQWEQDRQYPWRGAWARRLRAEIAPAVAARRAVAPQLALWEPWDRPHL